MGGWARCEVVVELQDIAQHHHPTTLGGRTTIPQLGHISLLTTHNHRHLDSRLVSHRIPTRDSRPIDRQTHARSSSHVVAHTLTHSLTHPTHQDRAQSKARCET